jgi:hypothetical protein
MTMIRLLLVTIRLCSASFIVSHAEKEHVERVYAGSTAIIGQHNDATTMRMGGRAATNADLLFVPQNVANKIATSEPPFQPMASTTCLLCYYNHSFGMLHQEQHQPRHIESTVTSTPTISPPPHPLVIAAFTLYDSITDQPLANFQPYSLIHEGNNWTVYQELYLPETGNALNIRLEFNQPVYYVTYYWDGVRRNHKDRLTPYFSGGYNDGDVLSFSPLRVPGNHSLVVRAMPSETQTWPDLTIQFQVIQAKGYLERVLINCGKDDVQYLSNPERSYSFGIDHTIQVGNAQEYDIEYFHTLRKSEYRGGSLSEKDGESPILYTVNGLRPAALHRVTIGFVETEPAYCQYLDTKSDDDGPALFRKSYFIFCNGDLFDHAYNALQYVSCGTAHIAHGYFPSTDQGTLTVALLSKFHPFETTVALVDIELFPV